MCEHDENVPPPAKTPSGACIECGGTGFIQECCGSPECVVDASGEVYSECCGCPEARECAACANIRAVIEKAEGLSHD